MVVVVDGPKHIGAQNEAVVHLDRNVPFHEHLVPLFRSAGHEAPFVRRHSAVRAARDEAASAESASIAPRLMLSR